MTAEYSEVVVLVVSLGKVGPSLRCSKKLLLQLSLKSQSGWEDGNQQ